MPILSIHIVAMSILSISITQAEFICYIKGDKVMCYIEQKSPAPAPCGRHGTRIAPLFGWVCTDGCAALGSFTLIAYKGTDK